MLESCEGDIASRWDGEPWGFVNELKRTCGFEAELVIIECSTVNIRNPQVHVLLSLADTCQVCLVSLKTGRTTYTISEGRRANSCFYL